LAFVFYLEGLGDNEKCTHFGWITSREERDHLEIVRLGRRLMLEWITEKLDMKVQTELNWRGIRSEGWFL
jgi:hypothetical protein